MTNAALVLFSLRECPHCQAAREYLRARGVPFVERDVREEAGAVHDLTKLTGECIVPTLSLAGDVQVGWDAVRVGAMLDDPLPPEEEDRLLAIIEETTGQDFGAGALTLPPPLPQQFDTVPAQLARLLYWQRSRLEPPGRARLHKSSRMTEIQYGKGLRTRQSLLQCRHLALPSVDVLDDTQERPTHSRRRRGRGLPFDRPVCRLGCAGIGGLVPPGFPANHDQQDPENDGAQAVRVPRLFRAGRPQPPGQAGQSAGRGARAVRARDAHSALQDG